jgi:hypothetical protein
MVLEFSDYSQENWLIKQDSASRRVAIDSLQSKL